MKTLYIAATCPAKTLYCNSGKQGVVTLGTETLYHENGHIVHPGDLKAGESFEVDLVVKIK